MQDLESVSERAPHEYWPFSNVRQAWRRTYDAAAGKDICDVRRVTNLSSSTQSCALQVGILRTWQVEVSNVGVAHALDQVLLNASSCGDHNIHHLVLHQVPAMTRRGICVVVVEVDRRVGKHR